VPDCEHVKTEVIGEKDEGKRSLSMTHFEHENAVEDMPKP